MTLVMLGGAFLGILSIAVYLWHLSPAIIMTHYFALTLPFILRGHADFCRKWFISHLIAGEPLLIWIGALTQQAVISFGIAWIPPVPFTDPFVTLWNMLFNYMGRDFVFYLPAILTLVLHSSQPSQLRQWASFLLIVMLIFGVITVVIRSANHEEKREGWPDASQHIERNFQPGDQLMVLNGASLIPFRRYTDDSFDPPTIEIEFEEPAPLVSGQRIWVMVRNPYESLHYPFRMPDFDPFANDGTKLSEWMRVNRLAYVDQWEYPGVTVLLFVGMTP